MNLFKIQYRDNQNWIDIDGIETIWTNYSNKWKPDRVRPSFFAPEVVTDTWNGRDTDIQHIRYNGFKVEFFIKESELNDIARLTSCKDIRILDYTAGIDSPVIYVADTTKQENFVFSEPEEIDKTSNFKITLLFRTSRTVINKGDSVDNTNYLQLDYGSFWKFNFETDTGQLDNVIAALSPTRLAVLSNPSAVKITTYDLKGSNWAQVGNVTDLGFSISTIDLGISAMTSSRVAIIRAALGTIVAYDFDGLDWAQVGNSINLPGGPYGRPRVSAMTSTRIAVVEGADDLLRAYDFDGTNWSLTGSTFSIASVTQPAITTLTSTSVAVIDEGANTLRSFDFNGSVWSQTSSDAVTVDGETAITAMSSTTIAYIDKTNKLLKSYTLNGGTWSSDGGDLAISNLGDPSLASLAINELVLTESNQDKLTNYTYGFVQYRSDYEILPYDKESEDLETNFPDITERTLQRVYKPGLEFLNYLNVFDKNNFVDYFKQSESFDINGTSITEVEFEPEQIAEDYYKIIVRGVTSVDVSDFDISPLNSNNITFTVGAPVVYYSDYEVFQEERPQEDVLTEWTDGTNRLLQTVNKVVDKFITYLDNNDASAFITNLKKSTATTINSNPITELEHVIEEISLNYKKITVTGLRTINITDYAISNKGGTPLTYHLEIIDSAAVTHDYYTDYPPVSLSENPTIESLENQTGINTPAKNISRIVKEVKFYLDESDAFDLKEKFELWGTTIELDTDPVLESRDVTPEKIGVDLYEVIVNCIFEAKISY